MKSKIGIFVFLIFLLFASDVQAEALDIEGFREKLNQAAQEEEEVKKAQISTFSGRYIVSPGDVINIFVFGEPELTQREIPVKCDGYVNLHPVGEIRVAGFNTDEVRTILTEKLKAFFVNPIVSVYISNMHTPKIYIYGAVQNPGLFNRKSDSSTPATLANLISNAGGITYNADLKHIQVKNAKTGRKNTYNLIEMIRRGDPTNDVYLGSGDTVFVPVNRTNAQLSDEDFVLISSSSIAPKSFPVRVRGAVNRPGTHFLTSRSPSINTALTSSEGFTIDANIKAVKVKRMTPVGNLSTIVVNPSENDLVLRPNDIICVLDKRRTVFGKGVRFFDKIAAYLSKFGSAFNQWNYAFDPETEHNIYLK